MEYTKQQTAAEIGRLLQADGIRPGISGYEYIQQGVAMVLEEPSLLHSVTKQLYPAIAKASGTSASCVERSVRYVLQPMEQTGKTYLTKLVEELWLQKNRSIASTNWLTKPKQKD